MEIQKIDDKTFTITTQPPTPEPVVTTYSIDDLKSRLLKSQDNQAKDNQDYSDEQASIQSLIDLANSNGIE